jgi:hypothetical protein
LRVGDYRCVAGRREGRGPSGRLDAVKMDLKETDLEFVGWIQLAQNRDQRRALVITVMNLQVP